MSHRRKGEEGAALTIALVAVALLTTLGASLFQQVRYEVRLAKTESTGEQALSAAEAGWNVAYAYARAGEVPQGDTITIGPTNLTFDNGVQTGAYVSEIWRMAPPENSDCYRITSTGRTASKGGSESRRVVRGWVRYDSGAPLNSKWKWCYNCKQEEVGC